MEKHQSQYGTLRWSHGILGIVLMFLLFSIIFSSLVTSQYTFQYMLTHMYPNSNLSTSDGSSCNVNTSTEAYRERTAAQRAVSQLNIYTKVAEAVPALIITGVMGGLGDRFGRTRILIFTTSLTFLSICVSSPIIYFEIDVYYFLISSTLYSLGGGIYGALSIGFAYISDVTSPGKQRTLMITLLEASIGIGAAISGLVSGFIIEGVGYFYSNICAGAVAAGSVLVVVLFLPPSRSPHISVSRKSNLENSRAAFTFYFQASPMRYKYVIGIISFMFASISLLGKQPIEILYQLNAPFCWTSVKVGYFSAISYSVSMILGMSVIKVLQMCFVEEVIAMFSGISGMAAYIVEAFAVNDLTLFVVPVIGFISVLVFPMIRSMLSKLTPADGQGALFAGIAVVEIASSLGANLGASAIYIATVGTMRGFVFLVFAGLSFLTTCLLLVYRITSGMSKTAPLAEVTKDITGTQVVEADVEN
ncbi:solute carrier family 46 member 3-like [Mizuhopecten yessoensis]|uniref:solute carrier family 46 member 3-like n=1 Tax=Mizuhopecten yessoensis TaxID=6573 RepID=UPI000B457EE6|nr:solute carrier family 46 member 3-like [Mizuhopecten yessoensis]XP_021367988.1 solute carrier family 46 member 3-like [Mizuhopecten yessoensis]